MSDELQCIRKDADDVIVQNDKQSVIVWDYFDQSYSRSVARCVLAFLRQTIEIVNLNLMGR